MPSGLQQKKPCHVESRYFFLGSSQSTSCWRSALQKKLCPKMSKSGVLDPEPCAPPVTLKHDGPEEPDVPKHCWSRRFDTAPPPRYVHKPSKPGVVEILGLLPVAVKDSLWWFTTTSITFTLQSYFSQNNIYKKKCFPHCILIGSGWKICKCWTESGSWTHFWLEWYWFTSSRPWTSCWCTFRWHWRRLHIKRMEGRLQSMVIMAW